MSSVLLATLGAEPQVISLATELLLAQGAPLCAVVVVHTRCERAPIDRALAAVEASFAGQPGWPPLQDRAGPGRRRDFPGRIEPVCRRAVCDRARVAARKRAGAFAAGGRAEVHGDGGHERGAVAAGAGGLRPVPLFGRGAADFRQQIWAADGADCVSGFVKRMARGRIAREKFGVAELLRGMRGCADDSATEGW